MWKRPPNRHYLQARNIFAVLILFTTVSQLRELFLGPDPNNSRRSYVATTHFLSLFHFAALSVISNLFASVDMFVPRRMTRFSRGISRDRCSLKASTHECERKKKRSNVSWNEKFNGEFKENLLHDKNLRSLCKRLVFFYFVILMSDIRSGLSFFLMPHIRKINGYSQGKALAFITVESQTSRPVRNNYVPGWSFE